MKLAGSGSLWLVLAGRRRRSRSVAILAQVVLRSVAVGRLVMRSSYCDPCWAKWYNNQCAECDADDPSVRTSGYCAQCWGSWTWWDSVSSEPRAGYLDVEESANCYPTIERNTTGREPKKNSSYCLACWPVFNRSKRCAHCQNKEGLFEG